MICGEPGHRHCGTARAAASARRWVPGRSNYRTCRIEDVACTHAYALAAMVTRNIEGTRGRGEKSASHRCNITARTPLHADHPRTGLGLIDTRILDSWLVLLEYQPMGGAAG